MTKVISSCYNITLNDAVDTEWLSALLFEWGASGIEETATNLLVYFSSTAENLSEVEANLKAQKLAFSKSIEEEKNWNQIWEESFQPVYIEGLVEIRASFHAPQPNFTYSILIDPKMSFGTGHHPTTEQVIRQMSHLDFNDKHVIDIGSGTGILAILAEMMGAKEIVAFDNDSWCYENCRENIALNHTSHVLPLLGEKLPSDGAYDIILANINRNYHLENLPQMAQILNDDGYMLLSGFLTEDVKMILDVAEQNHLIATYYTESNNWVCITLRKIIIPN